MKTSTGNIKLSEFDSNLIEEVSTLSGYSETTVRDVLELTLFRQLEQAMGEQDINIPFVGKIRIVFKGDVMVNGTREADFDILIAPSDLFKRLIGEIHDGDSEFLADLLQKKIGSVLQEKLDAGGK